MLGDCLFERLTITGQCQTDQGPEALAPCVPIDLYGFDVPGHEIARVTFRDILLPEEGIGILLRRVKDIYMDNVSAAPMA